MASTPRPASRRARAGRALLFIALSGVAVPACQHYDAGGKQEREQATLRLPVPAVSEPAAAGHQPAAHRA